jgi:hypothetical protein
MCGNSAFNTFSFGRVGDFNQKNQTYLNENPTAFTYIENCATDIEITNPTNNLGNLKIRQRGCGRCGVSPCGC